MRSFVLILFLVHTLLTFGQSKKELYAMLEQNQAKFVELQEIFQNQINEKNQEISLLKYEIDSLTKKITNLENSFKNEKLVSNKYLKENKSLKSELAKNADKLKKHQDTLIFLQNQLDNIRIEQSDNSKSNITVNETNDFLNIYYSNLQPLNNNSFTFKLDKIMTYGETNYNRNSYFSPPNIINVDEFYIVHIPEGINLEKVNWNSLKRKKSISLFNSFMPKIEILKNKLLTLENNNSEEDFMFNISKSENNIDDNICIQLATESVNDNSKDIFWPLRKINNETYIVLDIEMLERIGVTFLKKDDFDRVEYVYYKDREKYIYTSWTNIESLPIDNDSYDYSSKEAYWLVRKENNFSKTDIDVDPRDCLFLFKLNEEI
jgi:hypothetical protein